MFFLKKYIIIFAFVFVFGWGTCIQDIGECISSAEFDTLYKTHICFLFRIKAHPMNELYGYICNHGQKQHYIIFVHDMIFPQHLQKRTFIV